MCEINIFFLNASIKKSIVYFEFELLHFRMVFVRFIFWNAYAPPTSKRWQIIQYLVQQQQQQQKPQTPHKKLRTRRPNSNYSAHTHTEKRKNICIYILYIKCLILWRNQRWPNKLQHAFRHIAHKLCTLYIICCVIKCLRLFLRAGV